MVIDIKIGFENLTHQYNMFIISTYFFPLPIPPSFLQISLTIL